MTTSLLSKQPRRRRAFRQELVKAEAVRLCDQAMALHQAGRQGTGPEREVNRTRRVYQRGSPTDPLTTDERAELVRLRRNLGCPGARHARSRGNLNLPIQVIALGA